MAKNPYTKTVKLFSKAESLYIQRVEDAIFLSEGHIIVKIHIAAYDVFFRPASGQFIDMNDGEKAARIGNATMPEKSRDSFDISKCFDGFRDISGEVVTASPFLMEYTPCSNKKQLLRMFCGRSYYVTVNNDFYAIAEECGFQYFSSKGDSISPVFAESGDYNGIAILPVRADQQKIDEFIQAGAVR